MYFANRGFKDVDLTLTYAVKVFKKLIERIALGYSTGAQYIVKVCVILLIILMVPQAVRLITWFYLVR
jgi:hypothetical protein